MKQVGESNWFLRTALVLLLLALCLGCLSALVYLFPDFLKNGLGFVSLRPLHVSSALVWILLAASGAVYVALNLLTKNDLNRKWQGISYILWLFGMAGVFYSYFNQKFGGREYWELPPIWSEFILAAWLFFVFNVIKALRTLKDWPVYAWMWLTGAVFFLFVEFGCVIQIAQSTVNSYANKSIAF